MTTTALSFFVEDIAPSRRSFLIGAAAVGSSLVVGFSAFADVAPGAAPAAPNPFTGYLQISPDETVTIYSSQMDMGQGIYHGLATLVQEELDADWAKVSVAGVVGNPAVYGNLALGGKVQFTGGSSGTASSWERYRRAGATARAPCLLRQRPSSGMCQPVRSAPRPALLAMRQANRRPTVRWSLPQRPGRFPITSH